MSYTMYKGGIIRAGEMSGEYVRGGEMSRKKCPDPEARFPVPHSWWCQCHCSKCLFCIRGVVVVVVVVVVVMAVVVVVPAW